MLYIWQLEGIKIAGSCAPVLKLDFCRATACLAVGNECGLVRNLLFLDKIGLLIFFCTYCFLAELTSIGAGL